MVCQALKPHAVTAAGAAVPIDVHLMVQPVDALAAAFADAGADLISFHPDASARAMCTAACRPSGQGLQGGTGVQPAAPWTCWTWVIDDIDLILVASVNPGFGGQKLH